MIILKKWKQFLAFYNSINFAVKTEIHWFSYSLFLIEFSWLVFFSFILVVEDCILEIKPLDVIVVSDHI
ncbi:hypothetical protein MSBRW_1804 [Methanosarcina barkeri str. Wiesmoor]|uniref:Uncharacterized protein n=1 Tax=Methanosarcina barkeri str. Wiesmoor TaxID=1434109 RepID=A0A0E3QLF2_METBA|nr:hypothetical protein MSBRW_1804 [Methanosarcina barkeri str. Wiesmoor]